MLWFVIKGSVIVVIVSVLLFTLNPITDGYGKKQWIIDKKLDIAYTRKGVYTAGVCIHFFGCLVDYSTDIIVSFFAWNKEDTLVLELLSTLASSLKQRLSWQCHFLVMVW